MSELWQLSALEIAAAIRTGATNARDVVTAHDARIDGVNPSLNAVVRRLDESAAGLPVGVQDIGDRFTDLRCLAVPEHIQDAEGVHTPIDPVVG